MPEVQADLNEPSKSDQQKVLVPPVIRPWEDSPRIASMPPTGLLPLLGERLLPLALLFRQSCKSVVPRLPFYFNRSFSEMLWLKRRSLT